MTNISLHSERVQCAEEVGVDYTPIEACVDSVEGEEALHAVALEQEKLDPSLYFVPWIIVDDVRISAQTSSFLVIFLYLKICL